MNGCMIDSGEAFDWGAGERGKTFKISAFVATDMLLWEPEESDSNNFNDGSSSPGEGFVGSREKVEPADRGMNWSLADFRAGILKSVDDPGVSTARDDH